MKIPYYRIEAYLAHALSVNERESFEREMLGDSGLAQDVREQRGIVFDKSFEEMFGLIGY